MFLVWVVVVVSGERLVGSGVEEEFVVLFLLE